MALLRDLDLVESPISLTDDRGYLIQPTGGSPPYANKAWTPEILLGAIPQRPGGRLSVQSGVAVPAGDKEAKQVLYYPQVEHPFCHLRDTVNGRWLLYEYPDDLSYTLTSLNAGYNRDVFLYPNAGVPALELSADWTNDTTRSEALTTIDGFRVKNSDHSRLLVGTIRSVTSTTTCDVAGLATSMTIGRRFVANEFHKRLRPTGFFDTGADFGSPYDYSGSYKWGAEWLLVRRALSGDAWEIHVLVLGEQTIPVTALLVQTAGAMGYSGGYPLFGIGVNGGGVGGGSTVVPAQAMPLSIATGVGIQAAYGAMLTAGVPITADGYYRISVMFRGIAADATMVCDDVTYKQLQTGLVAMVEN